MPKIDVVHSVVAEAPKFNIHKKIIRTAKEDAFFKTGVEVVETEEYEFEGNAHEAAEAFKQGQLTAD